jgi:hypothetical protein
LRSLASWATLRVVKLSSADYLPAFAGRIPTLRHFTILAESSSDIDELNKFRGIDAPLETIYVRSLPEARIPYDFLHQYKNTVCEVGFYTAESCQGEFKKVDISQLNQTCPFLEKVSVYVHYSGQGPEITLQEFSRFDHLTELILDCGVHRETALAPTQDDCLALYHFIRGLRVDVGLRALGLHYSGSTNFVAEGYNWQDKLDRVAFLCQCTSLGNVRITRPSSTEPCYKIYHKIRAESRERSMQYLSFSRAYPSACNDRNLICFAKQLGPGPDWAIKELLPRRLLTQEDIDTTGHPTLRNLEDDVKAGGAQMENHREMVQEELQYWKQRRELEEMHGKYFTLYDILYPANSDEYERLEGISKFPE